MDVYLDNAATSDPKPRAVIDAVVRAMTQINANPGRSGHPRALAAARCVYAAREAISDFIGAEADSAVCFAMNCTDALNTAIKGVVRRGDHVISTMLEHNSVLRVLSKLSMDQQIALSLIWPEPDGMIDPEKIRRAIRSNTRLICMTHASNVTGAIQPAAAVGQIARGHGITYLIDGAQALGAIPVNVQRLMCDLYAFPGHKSLLGPQGTGGLYIRKELSLNTLREGGTGTDSQLLTQPEAPPERYEAGTVNMHGIAGLHEGVKYVSAHAASILSHEREMTDALYRELARMEGVTLYSPAEEAARCGIVTFNIGDMGSSQAADALSDRNICVRGGLHCAPCAHRVLGTVQRGAVRASVGYANSFDDVNALLRAVHEILHEGA